MKALRYENQTLSVADIDKPEIDGEVLVRVTLSGICNTDLEIARGYAGFEGTLGHEFVGIVEKTRKTTNDTEPSLMVGLLTQGRRVVGEINAGCGHCDLCRAGDSRHCPARTVLGIVGRDGAHAEFLKLPSVNLLPVPDEIPDEQAVFTEPLAAACGILERASITEDAKVAVIGDGKLGLLCAQVIATTGVPVTLIGKHEAKLRIAERRAIETHLLDKAKQRAREFDVVSAAARRAAPVPPGQSNARHPARGRARRILHRRYPFAAGQPAAGVLDSDFDLCAGIWAYSGRSNIGGHQVRHEHTSRHSVRVFP